MTSDKTVFTPAPSAREERSALIQVLRTAAARSDGRLAPATWRAGEGCHYGWFKMPRLQYDWRWMSESFVWMTVFESALKFHANVAEWESSWGTVRTQRSDLEQNNRPLGFWEKIYESFCTCWCANGWPTCLTASLVIVSLVCGVMMRKCFVCLSRDMAVGACVCDMLSIGSVTSTQILVAIRSIFT